MHKPKPFESFHGHSPYIVHFPGKSRKIYEDILNDLSETEISIQPNVSIVSAITQDHLDSSPLHKQLTSNDISYINPAIDFKGEWYRNVKPHLILDGLKKVKEEYAFVLDGDDLAIAKPIEKAEDWLKNYDCDILYNATGNRFPDLEVDVVEDRDKLGRFCYLNAGACFGRTEALLDLYKKVCDEIDLGLSNIDSEQYYVRRYFNKHQDTVKFDWQCMYFQAINIGIEIQRR